MSVARIYLRSGKSVDVEVPVEHVLDKLVEGREAAVLPGQDGDVVVTLAAIDCVVPR